jgi:preprotein translocase SecE subunit
MASERQQVKESVSVGELASPAGGDERSEREIRPTPQRSVAPRPAGGGLRIYKAGQGYYTRLGTAIGGGVLILWGAFFLLDELSTFLDPNASYYYPVQYGVAVGFILGMGALLYWIVGLNRKANDFFIATEGEMKKVNWSTRQEVVRSTKVVVVTVVLLGVFLFLADILFMEFFSFIKVLKTPSMLDRLFGHGS